LNVGVAALAASVLDALPSALLIVDEHGRAAYANTRAAEILGKSAQELLGADVSGLFSCSGTSTDQLTTRVRHPDGELATLGYTVSRVCHEGQTVCAISFRDISDTIRVTRERDRLLQLAAVGDATPTLLHEIRNPLSGVTSTIELLLEESAPGPTRDALHAALTEARRIALQLDSFGAVGRSLRSRRAFVIDEACRDVCVLLQPRAKRGGAYLRWDIPDLPLLPLDPPTVRAVLLNLVTNAIAACRPGDAVRVHVRLVANGDSIELSVVDTGAGMSAEVFRRCTDLFFTTKRHGSGIGLALCRRAVEQAGGSLEIQSLPDVGTAVTVTVPVALRAPDSEIPPTDR
jgi:signal transduction histidine kinase